MKLSNRHIQFESGGAVESNARYFFIGPSLFMLLGLVACGGGGGGGGTVTPVAPTSLTGKLVGPIAVGTQTALQNQATLQNNGEDNVSATVTMLGTNSYDQASFTFPTTLQNAATYSVSVLTPPVGQTCSAFAGGSGSMPLAANSLWVGCETTNDYLSRSTDNLVFGSYSGSSAPMLGGSSTAVGTTATAYGDGRYAVFLSSVAGLTSNATGSFVQVFWRDRYTGKTLMVSATAGGVAGNGASTAPVISADGQTVAFESAATNLVTGDTNAANDIFVWSALTPNAGVTRVSVGPASVEAINTAGGAASHNPTLSGDGKVVAFESTAINLVTLPVLTGNANTYVYRRDLTTSTNKLISIDNNGVGQSAGLPKLSDDGNRLVFETFWPLLANDTNALWDIYLYDDTAGSLTRVSLNSSGGERNGGTESASRVVAPTISGNGRYVAYSTTATNVVSAGTATGLQNVYVVDTTTVNLVMPVYLASVSSLGAQGDGNSPVGQGERLSLTYDGQWVAFTSSATNLGASAMTGTNVFMHNISTGETRALTVSSGFGPSGPVSMSRNGAYVAFWAGTALDPRFNLAGLFATFTGVSNAFFWTSGTLP